MKLARALVAVRDRLSATRRDPARSWRQIGEFRPRIRITLGARILAALITTAAASTIVTLLLQDSALSSDLRKAARGRLQQASHKALQLLDSHLSTQFERYRAISATPQFVANLEAGDRPTLARFAEDLVAVHTATSILFLDATGDVLASAGVQSLVAPAADYVRGAMLTGEEVAGQAVSTLLSLEAPEELSSGSVILSEPGALLVDLVGVPLQRDGHHFGHMVALEPLRPERLASWSKLCGALISFDERLSREPLTTLVRRVGKQNLRVTMAFDAEREALSKSRRNLAAGGGVGLGLACIVGFFLVRNLVRPIRAIQSATQRIGAGDLRSRLDDRRSDEVGDVARALNSMLDQLEKNIAYRRRVESQIIHLASHDSLTGLGNRRLLEKKLGLALQRSQTDDSSVAVMALDLDRFKDINDTLGHSAGDELLKEVAERLDTCIQTLGADEGDESLTLLTRLGGDEFTFLLPDFGQREDLERMADQILETLSEPIELRGKEFSLSASLGIAVSPDDTRDAEALLQSSGMAMYHAKNRGGRSYAFYSDSMHEIARKRVELESKLRRALENDEFVLFYQPKLELASGQVAGVEALIRWQDPERGLVSPGEFIGMAEETGAIVSIGKWALRAAVLQAAEWERLGLAGGKVAVNVSARQLEDRDELVDQVRELLEETGLDPKRLNLEITEGALVADEKLAVDVLQRLKEMGVTLSLDDFGTGYSSLSYLSSLPIDVLKIDRSFILEVDKKPEDAALVGSIIAMGKVLGLRTVVEGVETRKQRRFLEDLGCDEIQGFLFSVPVDAEEATALLARRRRKPRRKTATKKRQRK